MKSRKSLVIGGLLAAPFAIANAGPDILPGLWETKVEMSSESGQFEQAMAQAQQMLESMPPEQQEMMKEMMAGRGMAFNLADRTFETCITQADIEQFDIAETEEGCTQSFEETEEDHFRITIQCDDNGTSGEGEYIVNSDKSYTGTMVMQVDMNGQQDTMTMEQEGRWLSSDCGAVED